MEFEGLVLQLLPVVKGTSARGEWMKQEVVFEQPGDFGKKVCVSFWGDKAEDASKLKPGQKVKVSANVESREYNGRWYTEVRAWKLSADEPAVSVAGFTPDGGGFPPLDTFQEVDSPTISGATSSDDFDDLPF